MSSDEPLPDRCAAKCRSGGYCENYPLDGKERCRMHGGGTPTKEENPDVGAPERNGNSITHGATASPFNLYDHLTDDAVEWINSLAEGYRTVLGFNEDDPRNERVLRACIHIYQSHSGENQIMADGLSESQTIGISEKTGEPIIKDDGHHLHTVTLKRDKEARQILRTLGAFDDPESQKAGAIGDLASIITEGES